MGRIGQLAPISFVPDQHPEIQRAMQGLGNLPFPYPSPMVLIDPNLLSEVRF